MRPEHLSPSAISLYVQCPRKYRFRYVDQREPEGRSVELMLGSAVHAAIAWWGEQRASGREPTLETVLRIFRADFHAQALDPTVGPDEGRPDQALPLGERLVQLFVERFAEETAPVGVEQDFRVVLKHPTTGRVAPVPLRGCFDLGFEGGLGEIKTVKRRTSPTAWSVQLSAYAYAYQKLEGRAPVIQVIELIKGEAPRIDVTDVVLTAQDQAWFVELAAEVLDGILADIYFPIPGFLCPRCEYRRACRGM